MTTTAEALLFRQPLTDEQLDELLASIDESTHPGVDACLGVLRIAARHNGHDSVDAWADTMPEGKLSPWRVRIPDEQWTKLCSAIADRARALSPGPDAHFSECFVFVNTGPGAYTPEVQA